MSSPLEDHARRELELIGENEVTIEQYLTIVRAFDKLGHEGGSVTMAIAALGELLRFRNLSPLTDDPKEWYNVGLFGHQNWRNGEAFSSDGGITYTLMYEKPDCLGRTFRHHSVPCKTKETV